MRVYAIFLLFLLIAPSVIAQKFLVIDRYGLKQERLQVGDKIKFKQVGNPAVFTDYIVFLKDTTLIIATDNFEIPLNDFETFYFQRGVPTFLQYSGMFVGGGFLFASAVYPLVSDAQYDQRESFIIGASFLVMSQAVRFFKWKKYRMNRRARVRIIDTTFR